jgi:hypothetical protein
MNLLTTTTLLAHTTASISAPPSPTHIVPVFFRDFHPMEPYNAEISWAASSTITIAHSLALLSPLPEFTQFVSPLKYHLFVIARLIS